MKAGVIGVVLVICLAVTSIVLLAVMGTYLRNLLILRDRLQIELILNVNSGMNYLLGLSTSRSFAYEGKLSLGNDSVHVRLEDWGMFSLGTATTKNSSGSLSKAALIGRQLPKEKFAIYLSDQQYPLTLIGETKIKGDCFLPDARVKPGYFNYIGYTGSLLVEGKVLASKDELPALRESSQNRLRDLVLLTFLQGKHLDGLQYKKTAQATFSFLENTKYYFSQSSVQLDSVAVSGRAVLASGEGLTISATCKLTDVLVVAPVIRIKKGFTGSLQAFASDSLIIEEEVTLSYPSTLCLYSIDRPAYGELRNLANLNGDLFVGGEVLQSEEPALLISEKATVVGNILVNGSIDLRGKVIGSVACRSFKLKFPSVTLDNYLLNAEVNRPELSKSYLGSSIFSSSKSGICKWLY